MPTYTIQQDPPWMSTRGSMAPSTASMYSEDFFNSSAIPGNHPADVPPLKKSDPDHAHPQQQIHDTGPHVRQSKLPIFKQVRSMLHKPPPLTTPGNPKWDDYTGELSASGKESKVKPSSYTSPFDAAFKANRKRSPERAGGKLRKNKSRNESPVSVLRDEEITPVNTQPTAEPSKEDTDWSPVSPVSPVSQPQKQEPDDEGYVDLTPMQHPSMIPDPLSPNIQRTFQPGVQQTPPMSSGKQIKRKPVSRVVSTAENQPPEPDTSSSPHHSPSQSSDMGERVIDDKDGAADRSHFSWTTYAPSVAPGRQSIDTMAASNRDTRQYTSGLAPDDHPNSRFSWSTVATNMTHQNPQQVRADSPPPPLPEKNGGPPVQSILSRRRPVQRVEREEWAPPPRKESKGTSKSAATPKESSTPTSAKSARLPPLPKDSASPLTPSSTTTKTSKSNSKANNKTLPPPPIPNHPQTHLETLLASSRDLALQHRNILTGIRELEKVEFASPMDVPFATVRDAKSRLKEYRTRLDEVKLEERDNGVAIARARRKEEKEYGGDGETLWVRRVTS